jgi:nucleotide-binding universal stress UspA family protein
MRAIQSILVANDFLPATERIVPVATQLASVFDSHLTLFHVLEPSLDHADLRRRREQATARMRELVEQLALYDVAIDETAIGVATPADAIVQKAREIESDLVIVGAGEASQYDRPPAPTAQAVAARASQPVLIVSAAGRAPRFKRILCPVDLSTVSRRGLENAVRLARAFHGHVTVLNVVPEIAMPDSREEFERFLHEMDFAGVTWNKDIRKGQPDEEILSAATEHWPDLIVMGSTGRTGLRRFLLGSVTHRVLQHLPCCLLTIKGEDLVDPLLEADIRTVDLLMAQGHEMLAAGRTTEAAAKFQQVVLQDPFRVDALRVLAQSCAKVGRTADAMHYAHRASALEQAPTTA